MLGDVLNAVDKIISWSRLPSEMRRRQFSDHVEPAFHDIQRMHEGYLRSLNQLENLVYEYRCDSDRLLADCRNFVDSRRTELEANRGETKAIAECLASYWHELLDDPQSSFFVSLLDYLCVRSGMLSPITDHHNELRKMLEVIEDGESTIDQKIRTVSEGIPEHSFELRRAWSVLVHFHAETRREYSS
ncbi:MAG: hypothetical protein QF894_15200 [Alphaproteobacteria bacterium]|nr:hypothetical protein [Alphaproteobacteria bacterium]